MRRLARSEAFPNLFLPRPDGTSLELQDLRKHYHAFIVFLSKPDADVAAFVAHFQAEARLFEWLQARLLVVYARLQDIPTPWPAPGHPPFLRPGDLPEGLAWDMAYVVSKNGTLLQAYEEPGLATIKELEQELLYWEAGHCLP